MKLTKKQLIIGFLVLAGIGFFLKPKDEEAPVAPPVAVYKQPAPQPAQQPPIQPNVAPKEQVAPEPPKAPEPLKAPEPPAKKEIRVVIVKVKDSEIPGWLKEIEANPNQQVTIVVTAKEPLQKEVPVVAPKAEAEPEVDPEAEAESAVQEKLAELAEKKMVLGKIRTERLRASRYALRRHNQEYISCALKLRDEEFQQKKEILRLSMELKASE